MIYKCIEDFEIPVINENGLVTESILKITSGMFFKEIEDNALSGAEIKLESIFDDTFIEISKETLNSLFKDIEFIDLLEMQKQLDEEVAKPRENGFIPRERTLLDIKLALDDEFQEWLKELPDEYNFKTWKKKEYNRENELIELVDVFFFILSYINTTDDEYNKKYFDFCYNEYFKTYSSFSYRFSLEEVITSFKRKIWEWNSLVKSPRDHIDGSIIEDYLTLVTKRGFTKDEMIQAYLTKWKRNITVRVKEEW